MAGSRLLVVLVREWAGRIQIARRRRRRHCRARVEVRKIARRREWAGSESRLLVIVVREWAG